MDLYIVFVSFEKDIWIVFLPTDEKILL